jgi:hypothetical protein
MHTDELEGYQAPQTDADGAGHDAPSDADRDAVAAERAAILAAVPDVDRAVDGVAGAAVDTLSSPAYQGPESYLTRDDLVRLNDELTVADGWRANQEAADDKQMAGMLMYLYAARRIGLADPGEALLDFLGRMRQADFNDVLGEAAREAKLTAS